MGSTGFSLRKWYLDCVAENGDTLIGYAAALDWNVFSLHYSNILRALGDSRILTKTSVSGVSFPEHRDQRITWNSSAQHLQGTWTALHEPQERLLFESDEGRVTWTCLQPRSRVDIRFGDKEHYTGLGYAELLELTIKPWRLPVDELRWGRFHSPTDTVVWINWQGNHPLTLVFLNGRVTAASVDDERIVMSDGSVLSLSSKKILRSGPLVNTVLASIPGLDKVVPPVILFTSETKWRSRGQLISPGKDASTGWAIHEVVTFNTV